MATIGPYYSTGFGFDTDFAIANWVTRKRARTLIEYSRTDSVDYLLKVKEMQLSTIQVQQWLTDVSTTRAAPGFDAGF